MSKKTLIKAAQQIHDYCRQRAQAGRDCKGCAFHDAIFECCIKGDPWYWQMSSMKENNKEKALAAAETANKGKQ